MGKWALVVCQQNFKDASMKYLLLIMLLPLCLQCQKLTALQKRINYLAKRIRYSAQDNEVAFINLLTKKDAKKAKVIELLLACELGYKRVNIGIYKDIKRSVTRISNAEMNYTNTKFILIGQYRSYRDKHKISLKFLKQKRHGYKVLFSKRYILSISIQDAVSKLKTPSILNDTIVCWVKNKIGQQVGNGECWTLIAGALDFNEARHPRLLKFGILIPLKYIAVGDMIQYAGYLTPQHSAIVFEVGEKGKAKVAHQNAPPSGKKVGIWQQDFSAAPKGKVFFYRPIPK